MDKQEAPQSLTSLIADYGPTLAVIAVGALIIGFVIGWAIARA